DLITRAEPAWRFLGHADAVWGASENHGAGQKGRAAAEKFDQRRDVENHVVRVPVLHDLAVQHGANFQSVRIGDFVWCNDRRAERAEGIEGLSARPLSAAA